MRYLSYIYLLLLFITSRLSAQAPELYSRNEFHFEHLGIKEGLSQSTVLSIYQDSHGFMWLGTRDGLNRYNGYTFTIYRRQAEHKGSIAGNIINSITEDKSGNIWLATDQGISMYDKNNDAFTNYTLSHLYKEEADIRHVFIDHQNRVWSTCRWGLFVIDASANELIPASRLFPFLKEAATHSTSSVFQSNPSSFWVGTSRHGVYNINLQTQQIKNFPASQFGDAKIDALAQDQQGNLWVGAVNKGVYCLSAGGEVTLHLSSNQQDSLQLSHNNIRDLIIDNEGNVWIGTFRGLTVYDIGQKKTRQVYALAGNPNGLSHHSIRSFFKDNKGSIWIGTYFGGVSVFDRDNLRFRHQYAIPGVEESLSFNVIGALAEDEKGNLTVGTEGGGINIYNTITNSHTAFTSLPGNTATLSGNTVKSLFRDKQNRIWAGIFRGGLNRIETSTGTVQRLPLPADTAYSHLSKVIVNCIIEDKQGFLWLGTDIHGGLQKFNPQTSRYVAYAFADTLAKILKTAPVKWIWADKMGNLWLATHAEGLVVFNETSGIIAHFKKRGLPGDIPDNNINSVHGDKQGNIWLATQNAGIARFNPVTNSFTSWTTAQGLGNNSVYGILEEDEHTLWLSTLNSLSRFDKQKQSFRNYTYNSGMPLEETNEGAFLRTSDGQLVIGGKNGYIRFAPKQLASNSFVPPVHITSLKISNTEVKPGDNTRVLEKNIVNTKHLTLNYFHSVITFEYAALSFLRPQNNQYAYMLEGFDEEWNLGGNKRSVTYTNLPDGKYVFKVKGSNNDGIWNEKPTELHIQVLPPPWRTWWAYCLYALAIASGFFIIRHNAIKSAQLKHELRMEQFEKEKWKEIHQLKLEYFTDISHEIRTPLTLIYSPLGKVIQSGEGSPWLQKQLQLMQASCSRLLLLVDQILEVRQLESGKMELRTQPAAVHEVVAGVVASFKGLAEQKNIELDYIHTPGDTLYQVDIDKTEKIFFNLLSNAFKFTDEGGAISVRSRYITRGDKTYFIYKVADTGKGIARDQLEKIFDRFYKGDKREDGSGIGLSHTKALIELLGGKISVSSKPSIGTCFTLVLPFAPAGATDKKTALAARALSPALQQAIVEKPAGKEYIQPSGQVVLLAEDNDQLREYVREQLCEHVQVIAVTSAEEALKIAASTTIDLIFSDIMMENMSGLELCTKIKEDVRLCHIPVILLTARNSTTDRISGFHTGADDYISKPFVIEELIARMNSIFDNRRRIHRLYQQQTRLEPKEIAPSSYDEKLLKKIVCYIEENIAQSELKVEKLSEEVGLSRVHLYRKIKTLTGLAPADFIRDFRLKRAAQLLQTRKLKVAEVAYQVGFSDVHYFSKCFKKAYGMSPTALIEKQDIETKSELIQ